MVREGIPDPRSGRAESPITQSRLIILEPKNYNTDQHIVAHKEVTNPFIVTSICLRLKLQLVKTSTMKHNEFVTFISHFLFVAAAWFGFGDPSSLFLS